MNDNSVHQFVDTNILVYAYDASVDRKHSLANELLQELWENENGCLSIQVLQEFYVTITRKIAEPLSSNAATQIILDTTQWPVHRPEASDILHAIELHQRYQISFWDAMIVHSAQVLRCDRIWSEDLNPGQTYGGVQVANPFS